MMALDQGFLDMVQEGNIYVNHQNTQDVSALKMDTDISLVDSVVLEDFVSLEKSGGRYLFNW
jgi:hypothetical protein